MSEIWDCYDKNFNLVEGKVLVRGQETSFSEDEYHLVCDIAVKHTDGTFLLMQRDFRKEGYPGKWEFTAGGSALKGESPLECARRELFEETGLVADELKEIGRMTVARPAIMRCVRHLRLSHMTLFRMLPFLMRAWKMYIF